MNGHARSLSESSLTPTQEHALRQSTLPRQVHLSRRPLQRPVDQVDEGGSLAIVGMEEVERTGATRLLHLDAPEDGPERLVIDRCMNRGATTDHARQHFADLNVDGVVSGVDHHLLGGVHPATLEQARLACVPEHDEGTTALYFRECRVCRIRLEDDDLATLFSERAGELGPGLAETDDDDVVPTPPSENEPADALSGEGQDGRERRDGERQGRGEAGDVESDSAGDRDPSPRR